MPPWFVAALVVCAIIFFFYVLPLISSLLPTLAFKFLCYLAGVDFGEMVAGVLASRNKTHDLPRIIFDRFWLRHIGLHNEALKILEQLIDAGLVDKPGAEAERSTRRGLIEDSHDTNRSFLELFVSLKERVSISGLATIFYSISLSDPKNIERWLVLPTTHPPLEFKFEHADLAWRWRRFLLKERLFLLAIGILSKSFLKPMVGDLTLAFGGYGER